MLSLAVPSYQIQPGSEGTRQPEKRGRCSKALCEAGSWEHHPAQERRGHLQHCGRPLQGPGRDTVGAQCCSLPGGGVLILYIPALPCL